MKQAMDQVVKQTTIESVKQHTQIAITTLLMGDSCISHTIKH